MRSPPGGGKSSRVKELLCQFGVPWHGHVFSTDDLYIPVAYRLRHLLPSDLTADESRVAIEVCSQVADMWFRAKHSDFKKDNLDKFLVFRALFDSGDYIKAVEYACEIVDVLESVEYRSEWSPARQHYQHQRNFSNFKEALALGVNPIFVDNTNVVIRDAKPYAQEASIFGYEIEIVEPNSPHWLAHRDLLADKYGNRVKLEEFAKLLTEKNSHGVPYEVIVKMLDKWHCNMKVSDLLKEKSNG